MSFPAIPAHDDLSLVTAAHKALVQYQIVATKQILRQLFNESRWSLFDKQFPSLKTSQTVKQLSYDYEMRPQNSCE